jgi:CRISPR type III-B/RAMP module RAMP protein Cmr1
MTSLSYSISSRTPIVTGDHDRRNTELLATGILGSLRYQYWLLKAMQAWEKKQPYPHCSIENLPPANSTNFTEELHKAGPVIWLFGTTNWKKMFRLEIADAVQGKPQPCSARSNDRAPHDWKNFTLTFRQDRESQIIKDLEAGKGFSLENELRRLMAFVHQYGWLGAAPQNGLGWVEVQGEGLEQIILPIDRNNPVFAAKDVVLPASCVKNLLATLRDFYNPKLADAKRKLEAIEAEISRYGLNDKRKKERNWQHSRKIRYDNSLHFLDHKNSEFPVGYEIRRWLRDQNTKEQERFFGGKDHAGFVHVTHPDIQQDGSWHLRMRFTVRPGENGGINPIIARSSPAAWLNDCERLLQL